MSLADIIPDADYRFQMRFERGDPAEYFGPTPDRERLLSQRQYWLENDPATYAAMLPEGVAMLDEGFALARHFDPRIPIAPGHSDGWSKCLMLGQAWEPDFLLLKPGQDREIRLLGGSVCFPSSWSLSEKVGKPIELIHEVVPGMNTQIGAQIHTFLSRLKPGVTWLRSNWGLSRSPDLNQHPKRNLPRLGSNVGLGDVWFRVEHQALLALPESEGILFGIRLAVHPLAALQSDSIARPRLIRALRTMPDAVAHYKGLAAVRDRLISIL